jgi:hypothetical protein
MKEFFASDFDLFNFGDHIQFDARLEIDKKAGREILFLDIFQSFSPETVISHPGLLDYINRKGKDRNDRNILLGDDNEPDTSLKHIYTAEPLCKLGFQDGYKKATQDASDYYSEEIKRLHAEILNLKMQLSGEG